MNKRTIDTLLLAGIAALTLAFSWQLSGTLHDHVVVEGEAAPDFSIRADSGHTLTNTSFDGKVLILNFWATWCPPCITEMPSLDQLQRQYASRGLVVLGVSWDQDEALYKKFLARNHVNFQTAREPDRSIGNLYGTIKIPESYIIDRNGKVLRKIVGAANWTDPQLTSYVESLL